MARVSTSITPDLLLPDKYNQQNLYSINGVDPGGGDQEFGDDDDVYHVMQFVVQNIPHLKIRLFSHFYEISNHKYDTFFSFTQTGGRTWELPTGLTR